MKKYYSKLLYIYYAIVGFILIFYKELSNLTTDYSNDLYYVKCGTADKIPRPVPQLTSIAYTLLLVGTPLVLIVFSIITLVKANAGGNADEIDKAKKKLIKKFVIAAVVFFIFFVVQFIIYQVSNNDEDKTSAASCLKCFLYYSTKNCSDDGTPNSNNSNRVKKSNSPIYINPDPPVKPSNSNSKSNIGPLINNNDSGWHEGTYGSIKYLFYIPPKVPSNKPLIIQLHGAGECNADYKKFDSFGYKKKTDSGKAINAYILMPIIPKYTGWIDYDKDVFGLIEKVVSDYGIDKNKITIGGISLGANGVPRYLAKHPGYFANAILYAIGYEPDADIFKDVNTWIVWGDQDNGEGSHSATHSPNLYKAINNKGYSVRKTMYPGLGHVSEIIDRTIDDEYFETFINQSKK